MLVLSGPNAFMITLYRFVFAILARLLMLGLGGLLVWNGTFYVTILLNQDAREMLFRLGTSDPDWANLVFFCSVGFCQIAAGALLLLFGARGLWHRIRAGWPSDDESRATTTSARMGSVAIFGAGAMLGLLRLGLLIFFLADQAALALTGVETNAVITSKWTGEWAPAASDKRPTFGHQIEYEFSLRNGDLVQHQSRVSGEFFRRVNDGTSIQVVYSASDPSRSEVEFAQLGPVLMNVLLWLGLASVGIWGVWRNLGRDDSDEDPPMPQTSSAPGPRPFLQAQPRTQFGRRGS